MLFHKTINTTVGAASAAIAGLALTASLLLPSTALADDECGTQIDSGNPESFNCSDPDYGGGVTYTTDGDLTLNFDNAGSPARSNIGGVGIGVTGIGSDDVTIDSASTATELDSAGATGALVGVTTANGSIDIDVEDLDADFAPTTHGIYAESTGSGSIFIDTIGTVDAQSGTNPDTSIGIEAITNSGDIEISTTGLVTANQYGIRAESGGALTLDVSNDVTVNSTLGVAAINAITTGSDDLVINILSTGSQDQINGQDGNAILTDAGGDLQINIGEGRTVTNGFGVDAPVLDLTAAGETVINNDGTIRVNSGSVTALRAAGGTLTINNNGRINRNIDLSGLTGGYTFNNNAGALWDATAFGGGQTGNLVTELGTGEFNNAGTIELSRGNFISAPGTTFTASGDSLLRMEEVILDGESKSSCAGATVAGCLDLSGGATSGLTNILIATRFAGNPDPFAEALDKQVNAGVLLVDVSGGTSHAGDFVLDPQSSTRVDTDNDGQPDTTVIMYAEDPIYGAVLDTGGLFDYALLYNPTTQQHILSSVPQVEGLQYAALIQESLSVWHTTSDAVAGRQADLRDGGDRGGWVRVINESTERDFKPSVTTHGNTFNYSHGYTLDIRALIAGYDLTADDNHVLGVHLGFIGTRLEHDDSPTKDEAEFLSGASSTFGAYAGWWNESGLTLDGTINVNLLDIEHDVRDGLEDTRTNVITAGIRAEAGWRFPVAETFYVQPLVTGAYAYADVENLDMRDYDAKFEDETSMRAALGVRLGGETQVSDERFSRIKYWLTARAWEEYAEDGNVQFQTDGDPLIIEDDISDTFEEVGLGVSFVSPDEDLEVFLSGNVVSGDQTDSTNVTIGARLRW